MSPFGPGDIALSGPYKQTELLHAKTRYLAVKMYTPLTEYKGESRAGR